MSPASAPLASLSLIAEPVLSSSSAGSFGTGVLTVSLSVTGGPAGGVPVAVAVLSTLPASTSAWLSV